MSSKPAEKETPGGVGAPPSRVALQATTSFAFGLLGGVCFLAVSMVLAYSLGENFAAVPQYYGYAVGPLSPQTAAIAGILILEIILAILWVAYEVGVLRRVRIRDLEQGTGYGMLFGLLLWVIVGILVTYLAESAALSHTKLLAAGDVGLLQISELVGFFVYGLVGGYATSVERKSRLAGSQ